MLTLDQKVTVECTDTGVTASGKIIRIRPDGFDVALGDLIIRLYRHKPQICWQSIWNGICRQDVKFMTLPDQKSSENQSGDAGG